MNEEWDIYLVKVSELLEARENYQKILGRMAFEISEKYGPSLLADFSNDIKEGYGLSISPSTLRNYKWVWEKTNKLALPEDISYRTLQYIASSGKPEYWATKIKEEGLSSAMVFC